MTSSQFLIVKMQAILGGRAGDSEMRKRSIAMEYYKRCGKAEAQLEHCVALIKAGREYPALQVAESSNLMDSLNELMFAELPQWREYCAAENLPVPPPFDDSQIELVNSIYTKGVSQNHPLYRDYRRAMRLRKYSEALAVIKTISKINSYDAEARRECDRLRKRVAAERLSKIEAAMRAGDGARVEEICAELEPDAGLLSENPVWREAAAFRRSRQLENERRRCSQILSELDAIDIDTDFSKASDLITEFNLIRENAEFPQGDIDYIEDLSRKVAKKQDMIIAAEKAARARNFIKMELEKGIGRGKIGAKISRLEALAADAGETLGREEREQLASFLSRLKFRRRVSSALKLAGVAVAACAAALAAFWVQGEMAAQRRASLAESRMAEIEQMREASGVAEKLAAFERDFPDLSAGAFSGRISAIRESSKAAEINLKRFKKILAETESVDFAAAGTSKLDAAASNISSLSAQIGALSPVEEATYLGRIEALNKKLRAAVESKKIKNARETKKLLEKFEAVAEEYENFARAKPDIDADAAKIAEQLRPLIEDTSSNFKAHRLDIDKYNELSVRISDAKNRYAKFDKLREKLSQSRDCADFLAAVDVIGESGDTTPEYARKISRIAKLKPEIKLGQLAAFGTPDAAAGVEVAGRAVRLSMPENEMLTGLYKYSKGGKYDVYTLGKITEKVNKWRGGSETIQDVREVGAGGKISTVPYRKHMIDGKTPRGELLEGGEPAPESKLGAEVFDCCAVKSALAALNMIAGANVNAAFKTRLEAIVLAKLAENPIGTLFEYSPLAKARAEKVSRFSGGMTDYSWIFESSSREKLLAAELYSSPAPDYCADALLHLNAFKIALENPLELVGVCDENGVPSLFKDPTGALWGVSASGGKFARLGAGIAECKKLFAPLSPVFSEKLSSEEIMRKAAALAK